MNNFDLIVIGVILIFVIYFGVIGLIHGLISLAGVFLASLVGVIVTNALSLPGFVEGIIFLIILVLGSGIAHQIGRILGKVGKILPGNHLAGALLGVLYRSLCCGFLDFYSFSFFTLKIHILEPGLNIL